MNGRRVTLLKNYGPARQHSLNAYAAFLEEILSDQGTLAGSWRPHGLYSFRKGAPQPGFVAASIDKYGIAPIEAAFHPADILHIADNSNAWLAFTSRYRTLVVTVHDLVAWRCANGMLEGWNPSRAARAVLHLNFAAMRRADTLLAVSETTRDDLLAAGFDARRIRVIRLCNLASGTVVADGTRWRGVDLRTTFVHFGAGKYPKHSELVVEAFARVLDAAPSARLLLIGPRAAELATALPTASVETHDVVTAGQIRYLYDHIAAVVMPSRFEGFGLPVIEAQERDCLIVTSDGGALAEVMQDGPLKLPRPIDPSKLAHVMLRVLDDDSFRQSMREAGRRNAARFSRDRTETAYRRFYTDLCSELVPALEG